MAARAEPEPEPVGGVASSAEEALDPAAVAASAGGEGGEAGKAGEGGGDSEAESGGPTRQARAPWHFKVILVGSVVYLGWRAYQGISWLTHHIH